MNWVHKGVGYQRKFNKQDRSSTMKFYHREAQRGRGNEAGTGTGKREERREGGKRSERAKGVRKDEERGVKGAGRTRQTTMIRARNRVIKVMLVH